MKRNLVLTAVLIVTMIFTAIPAFAGEVTEPSNGDLIPGKVVVKELTYDEYIDRIAEHKGITRGEAIELDRVESVFRQASTRIGMPRATAYRDVSRQFTYSKNTSFKMASEATVRLDGQGSMYGITKVMSHGTRGIAGVRSWSWVQSSKWMDNMDGLGCTFGFSGYFKVTGTVSGGVPGFSISGSSTYTSDTFSKYWRFQLNFS